MRSGEQSQNSPAKFYVEDCSDDSEGVAAFAFTSKKMQFVNELPKIDANTNNEDKAQYILKSHCSKEMLEYYIKEKRHMPQCILAIPILVHGKTWGVIVFDSRYEKAINDPMLNKVSTMDSLVSKLLEEL